LFTPYTPAFTIPVVPADTALPMPRPTTRSPAAIFSPASANLFIPNAPASYAPPAIAPTPDPILLPAHLRPDPAPDKIESSAALALSNHVFFVAMPPSLGSACALFNLLAR